MTTKSHSDPREDLVYRALAHPARREILDLVRAHPGITLGDLADRFTVSRFAIRKHLQVLMEAGVVTVTPDGTYRRHHLNPVPIQYIYDRWLSSYSARWASALTGLKYQLEREESTMSTLQHHYEVYIRATADAVWQAITDPAFTEQFFYGTRVESDFKTGSAIRYANPRTDESVIQGEVVEATSPKRLVHTFDFGHGDGASRVTYQIEDLGEVCKLTLVHDGFESQNKTYEGVKSGWNPILSGLKTLLETGEALHIPMPQEAS